MGAPPRAAADALAAYYAEWADGGPDGAWPGWLDRICTIGDGIGAIIGAPREDLARFHSWSWELNELLPPPRQPRLSASDYL